MIQRKAWTPQEDKVLTEIIVEKKIKKWCAIARSMEVQYKIDGRSGKQCRQRWHNHLDPNIKRDQWTQQEEKLLFRMHDEYGNSWSKMAKSFSGRTDNSIKNHFYSTLRKAIRKINRFICNLNKKGDIRPIKNMLLSKIILVAEDKFENKLKVDKKWVNICIDIKNSIIKYAKEEQIQQKDQKQLLQLIKKIMVFNSNYKKQKSKKKRQKEDDIQPEILNKRRRNNRKQSQSRNVIQNQNNSQIPPQIPKKTIQFKLNTSNILQKQPQSLSRLFLDESQLMAQNIVNSSFLQSIIQYKKTQSESIQQSFIFCQPNLKFSLQASNGMLLRSRGFPSESLNLQLYTSKQK